MLSCKTDSAKLKHAGGPVSSASISSATGGNGASGWTTYSREVTNCVASAAFTHFATTARRSLQHGVFGADFFFAGADCIGQPVISGADSNDGAKAPSAQWFERANHAASARTTINDRTALFRMPEDVRADC